MAKNLKRSYSRYTQEALSLLAKRIRSVRLERGITTEELAQRAGISRDFLYRIEQADPACGIGVVFEVASLLGLTLFQSEYEELILKNKIIDEKLALLPKRVRSKKVQVDDDF